MFLLWSIAASAGPTPPAGAELLALYEAVRIPLATDQLDPARAAARRLAGDGADEVGAAALRVADAADAASVRSAFGELSRAVVLTFESTAVPDGVRVYRCPMQAGYAFWLQAGPGIANPYMGTSMPACGEGTSFKAAAKAARP